MKARVTAFAIGLSAAAGVYAADTAISGYDYTPNSYSQQGNVYGVRVNGSGQLSLTLLSGEDQTNNVIKTEQRFSYCVDDADIVCNAAPAFLHAVSCWPEDAAATAGRVQIRDATAAGAGTVVWQDEFAAAEHTPSGAILDIEMTAGIVIDFDTTADVFCTVSYRDNG